jgi:hypothetical protein
MKKYTKEGEEIFVIKAIDGGFLGKKIYYTPEGEDENYEPEEDECELGNEVLFFEQLFDKPLTIKYASDVNALLAQQEKIQNEINDLLSKKYTEESTRSKLKDWDVIQNLVDYLTGDFNFILYLKDFSFKKREQTYLSSYISLSNTKNNGWYLKILNNDNYDSDYDKEFRVFKTIEELNQFAKTALLKRIADWKCSWSISADDFNDWFKKFDKNSSIVKDSDVEKAFQDKLSLLKKQDDIERASRLEKEIKDLEEKKKKLSELTSNSITQ